MRINKKELKKFLKINNFNKEYLSYIDYNPETMYAIINELTYEYENVKNRYAFTDYIKKIIKENKVDFNNASNPTVYKQYVISNLKNMLDTKISKGHKEIIKMSITEIEKTDFIKYVAVKNGLVERINLLTLLFDNKLIDNISEKSLNIINQLIFCDSYDKYYKRVTLPSYIDQKFYNRAYFFENIIKKYSTYPLNSLVEMFDLLDEFNENLWNFIDNEKIYEIIDNYSINTVLKVMETGDYDTIKSYEYFIKRLPLIINKIKEKSPNLASKIYYKINNIFDNFKMEMIEAEIPESYLENVWLNILSQKYENKVEKYDCNFFIRLLLDLSTNKILDSFDNDIMQCILINNINLIYDSDLQLKSDKYLEYLRDYIEENIENLIMENEEFSEEEKLEIIFEIVVNLCENQEFIDASEELLENNNDKGLTLK